MKFGYESRFSQIVSGSAGVLIACLVACGGTTTDRTGTSIEAVTGAITVSGTVTDAQGLPKSGVVIHLSGSSQTTATTGANGTYAFTALSAGSYSVSATSSGCTFDPSVANLNNLAASTTVDFAGQGASCGGTNPNSGAMKGALTISGHVRNASGAAIVGVQIQLNGSTQGTRVTDSTGAYVFHVDAGSYSLTAHGPCTIVPNVVNLNNVTTSKTQDFTATTSGCVTAPPADAGVSDAAPSDGAPLDAGTDAPVIAH